MYTNAAIIIDEIMHGNSNCLVLVIIPEIKLRFNPDIAKKPDIIMNNGMWNEYIII